MPRLAGHRVGAVALVLAVLLLTRVSGEAHSAPAPLGLSSGSEQYATLSFPIGSHVIPMDDRQADRLRAFGLVHLIARLGGVVYRVVEPPDVTLYTQLTPSGDVFGGGPLLVLPGDESALRAAQLQFQSVLVLGLTKGFTSDRVCEIRRATSILVIHGSFGRTELVLDEMGIPYSVAQRSDVEANPQLLAAFDLIIDDCPGWRAKLPADVISAMRARVSTGGEIIFTDIAIDDLNQAFPGYCAPIDNHAGTWEFNFHNVGEFLTQYAGPPVLPLFTTGGGVIVESASEGVTVFLDSRSYGSPAGPAVAGFYFTYGDGVVEGLAFHPPEQASESRVLASAVFGNKFVHSVPAVPTPTPSPTPGAVCVDWTDYTREEFTDTWLAGWFADDGGGVVEVDGSLLHLGPAAAGGGTSFPVLARNDAFPPQGELALELSFRFSEIAPYGTTIGVGSMLYGGERYPEGDVAPQGIEDILSIHHFADSFRIKLLGGNVTWEASPGDEGWHTARVEVQRRGGGAVSCSLIVDGRRIGSATGGDHPVSIFLGNPSIQRYAGPWTELHVDYIRVKYCEVWGEQRVRLPMICR